MKYIVSVLLLVSALISGYAQDTEPEYPVIGQPCPEFKLMDVKNYHKEVVSLSDLRGRYVVLDFWHRHCASCISSMPKMNELSEKFKDKVDIIMVGLQDEVGLDGFYDKLQSRYDLKMAAVHDSSLYHRFVPGLSAPHLMLIDDKGIIVAITNSIDQKMLSSFIRGESFDFIDRSNAARLKDANQEYDVDKLLLLGAKGDAGIKFRFRSMLLDFEPNEMPYVSRPLSIEDFLRTGSDKFEAVGALDYFYRTAYFGIGAWTNGDTSAYYNYHRNPIYEIEDTSLFEVDLVTWENTFWYSLYMSTESMRSKEKIMKAMRQDLARAFGYDIAVKTQMMPFWKVVASKDAIANLKTHGDRPRYIDRNNPEIQKIYNMPFEQVLRYLFRSVYPKTYPVINGTGFVGNIDIDFRDGLNIDFGIIRKELERHGVFLVEERRPFKVITIREGR